MSKGWISLYRKLQKNPLWTSEPFTRGQAWVDLILLANHEPGYIYVRDHKITLKRGDVGWSQNRLSERWQWSRTKVRKFLNDLEKEQQVIQVKSKSYTVIRLINYKEYQQEKQQKDNRKTTEEQQKDTNNNVNNVNKGGEKTTPAPEHPFRGKPESLKQVEEFFKNHQLSETQAREFFDHFNMQGWVRKNGMAITSWQSAASMWIRKEIHNPPQWKNGKSNDSEVEGAVFSRIDWN